MNANEARAKFGHRYEMLKRHGQFLFESPVNPRYNVAGYQAHEVLGPKDTLNDFSHQFRAEDLDTAIEHYHLRVMENLREVREKFKAYTGKHIRNVLSARRREFLPIAREKLRELDALIAQGEAEPGCFVEVVNLEDELNIEPHLEIGTPVYLAKANDMEIYVHNITKLSIYDQRGTTFSTDPRHMEYDFIVEMVTDGRSGLRLDADGEIALGNYHGQGFFRTREGAEAFLREAAQKQLDKIKDYI